VWGRVNREKKKEDEGKREERPHQNHHTTSVIADQEKRGATWLERMRNPIEGGSHGGLEGDGKKKQTKHKTPSEKKKPTKTKNKKRGLCQSAGGTLNQWFDSTV